MKTSLLIAGIALVLILAGCATDTVTVTGAGTGPVGLLVDGTLGGSSQNDNRFTGSGGAAIPVGLYDAPPGEVIAFSSGNPPTLKTGVNWTPDLDSVTTGADPKFRVKFRIWIVKGPFAEGQAKAVNACIRTAQIWQEERQGLGFSAFEITDATSPPNAANYLAFTCAKTASMKTDLGFDNNAVNVYWVDTVDFGGGAGTGNGVWCGGNVVAMGWNTSDHLFSHEIGHAFGLQHVNDLTASFDTENVMHNASNQRRYLTEGQTYRAVVNSDSVVNSLGGRTGTTRNCGNNTAAGDAQCPPVLKRIWADGSAWPPN